MPINSEAKEVAIMHGWDGFGMGGGMMFFWVILLLVVIAVIVWAVGRASGPGQAAGPSAEETLKQRYVRGEITKEQYDQILADLRRS